MRFVAYWNEDGKRVIGVQREDMVHFVDTIGAFYKHPSAGREKAAAALESKGRSLESLRIAVPVPLSAKVFCVGLNYREHAEESEMETTERPNIFGRWSTSLIAHGEESAVPLGDWRYDWEGELAVVLAGKVVNASPADAEAKIFGYTCFNDLSARDYQLAVSQWTVGKNADRSGPIGPAIVSADDISDPYMLQLETRVNGEVMQTASTSEMVHRAPEILSYLSKVVTLSAGDVLALGTPAGIGHKRTPPRYLKRGDTVEVEIEKIGTLRTRVT